jgi:hypothetical protein
MIMATYFGPPAQASPPELTRQERRERKREKERQRAKVESRLRSADCYECGAANDEPRCLCSDCQGQYPEEGR